MRDEHDEVLVEQYLEQVQILAARAQQGEDVSEFVRLAVSEACQQFQAGDARKEQANLDAFRSMLGVLAFATEIDDAEVRKTLEFAKSLVHKSN